MLKTLTIVSLMLFSMQAFSQVLPDSPSKATAAPGSTPASTPPSNYALMFQIIQDEFVLDNSTVKNARIIENENGGYQGLNVELTAEAAKIFTEMTQAGQGRRMNIVFNKVVVSSATIQGALSENFLISGVSKQDAQTFLNALIANKPKPGDEAAQS